jgi:hypothetical protein
MAQKFSSLVLIVFAVLLSACSDWTSSVAPNGESWRARAPEGYRQFRNIDEYFTALAQQVPGFGGFHFDQAGNIVIHLTDPSRGAAAEAEIRNSLRGQYFRVAGRVRHIDQMPARVEQAEYDFLELKAWKDRATSILGLEGVHMTGVAHAKNRLDVGVDRLADPGRVAARLVGLGIPPQAVSILVVTPLEFTRTLSDPAPRYEGGLLIRTPQMGTDRCTLGFNVYNYDFQHYGFVTASHCTSSDANDGEIFHQPSTDYPAIGKEKVDRQFQPGLSGCPDGKVCRWADAVYVQYTDHFVPFDRQEVARPAVRDQWGETLNKPIEIDSINPTMYVMWDGGFPIENQELDKIGVRSGWTYGPVKWPCRNWVDPDNTNHVLLCQDGVHTGVQKGDSGGPVFQRMSEHEIKAFGIVVAKDLVDGLHAMWISAMTNIRNDLGLVYPDI